MLKIIQDSPSTPEVSRLLDLHLELMHSVTPPESVYALDHNELSDESVTFWSVWQDSELCGCCALKEHTSQLAEIKSMHTSQNLRGRGVGQAMLEHIIETSKSRGYKDLKLETGIQDAFVAARKLYEKIWISTIVVRSLIINMDPNSAYMWLELIHSGALND